MTRNHYIYTQQDNEIQRKVACFTFQFCVFLMEVKSQSSTVRVKFKLTAFQHQNTCQQTDPKNFSLAKASATITKIIK